MTTIGGLRPTFARVLDAIHAHVAEHAGVAPKQEDLAAACGLARGTVSGYLGVLEARGYIRRHGTGRFALPIQITSKPWPPAETTTTESDAA